MIHLATFRSGILSVPMLLATACSFERPLADRSHAAEAARICGVAKWELGPSFWFDAGELHTFSVVDDDVRLSPFPSDPERLHEWEKDFDRAVEKSTKIGDALTECLEREFDRMGVKVAVSAMPSTSFEVK